MKLPVTIALCAISFFAGAGGLKIKQNLSRQLRIEQIQAGKAAPFDVPWWNTQVARFKFIGKNKPIVIVGDSRVNAMEWGEFLGRDDVSGRGISSETIPYTRQRLEASLPDHAKVVFVEIGINDVIHNESLREIANSYRALIKALKTRASRVVMFSIIQSGRQREDLHKAIAQLNTELRRQASAEGVRWVDLNPTLCPTGYLDDDQTTDGIHFGFQTYLRWRLAILRELKEMKV